MNYDKRLVKLGILTQMQKRKITSEERLAFRLGFTPGVIRRELIELRDLGYVVMINDQNWCMG